jgi:hypothetical protein
MMPDTTTLATPLAYALAYAAKGWHVLPLEPNAKVPLGRLVPRGMHDATTDPAIISAWWAKMPHAGIGVALSQSGLVAVDVDPRNGGTDTFEQLQAEHGSLQSHVMAFTGGGGEHHVFVVPHGAALSLPGTLGPGVDLKANGYIVVEPSVHPSGRQYGWEASSSPLDGVVPSPLPDWLRSLRVELKQPAARAGDTPVDSAQAREAREALYMLSADDYQGWVQAGMALHATGWGHPAYAMWCAWSQQSSKFDATVCRRKWESFSGDDERGALGITLAWVFAEAQRLGWKNPRSGVAQAAPAVAPAGLPILNPAQLQQAAGAITWAVKHVIPSDSVGVMFGGSGTFKSFIALDFALHMAHGLSWMGKKTKRGPVLFIAAEGGAGLWNRVHAWHKVRNLKWGGIEFYVIPVAVALASQASAVVAAAQYVGITPAAVIVDTMSQTFEGEENSSNEVASYLRVLGTSFRALWRCTVLVIHHSGHSATERPRGSSAIRANVDFMLGVFRDEKQMLATMEVHKQKDGELLADMTFDLASVLLRHDEDGEAITSLTAAHINDATDLMEAMKREGGAGRGGRNVLLLGLVQQGMTEKELRKAFYEDLADVTDIDKKKVAFYRARDWAMKAGFFEIAGEDRRIIVLKEWS